MIVDNVNAPENIDEMTQDEIKKWLFRSIMKDTEILAEELGLQIDADLVEKIKKTKNLDKKSALELEYIKKVHSQVDDIVQNFDKSAKKSTKWDSWPKKMREIKEFNCVGATLLGIHLLENGGIKSYCGNPADHILNIVKLSNGEWWYVDFMNGKKNIKKIEPEEIIIAETPVLKTKQPNIDYKLIPIYENSEVVGSVLGNLSCLKQEAEDPNISDENIEKREAKEYLEKYSHNFQKADFSLLQESLYPKLIEIDETEEMQQEIERINTMREFVKPVQDYVKTLTIEQKRAIIEEVKHKKEAIESLFYQEDTSVLEDVSPKLRKALELFLESLKDAKDKQPEVYQEVVELVIDKMRSL
ncbi:MAG: hypothetical protein AAB361_03325 [Patescibacteria group bacterium]